MVQIIGLMIGSYIMIRMLSFASREGAHAEITFVRIMCLLNLLFTFVLTVLLFFSGFEMPR